MSSATAADEYAIPRGALSDPAKLRQMSAFFWWTAWAPQHQPSRSDVTYTQNWPHEPLIGNRADRRHHRVERLSFVLLLAGVGGMVWYFASQPRTVAGELLPATRSAAGPEADAVADAPR